MSIKAGNLVHAITCDQTRSKWNFNLLTVLYLTHFNASL